MYVCSEYTVMERQYLPYMCVGHHELESMNIDFIIVQCKADLQNTQLNSTLYLAELNSIPDEPEWHHLSNQGQLFVSYGSHLCTDSTQSLQRVCVCTGREECSPKDNPAADERGWHDS